MEVRAAEKSDLPGVAGVAREAWWQSFANLLDPETIDAVLDTEYSPGALAFRMAARSLYVAVEADEVVGFVECRNEPDFVLLAGPHVHPDHRHRGVAGSLLAVAGHIAPGRPVCADVLLGNLEAEAFFEKQGFVPGETFEGELGGEAVVERRWWLARPAVSETQATIVHLRG